MPPKRRSTGATAKSSQSTLAFHGTSNKVTKPGTRASNAKKNLLTESLKKDDKPEVASVKVEEQEEEDTPTTAEAAIIEQTEQVQEQAQSTPEEIEARQVKPKQLQAYWKKLNPGSARRYHQEDLSLEEKILRKFDMTAQFGVSSNIGTPSEAYTNATTIALYRYCSHQTLAASAAPRSRASDRSSCGAVTRAGYQ